MKPSILKTFLFLLLLFTISYAQNDKIEIKELNDCPPLYTRSPIQYTNIKIEKVGILDSNKYSTLPKFILDKDSIAKLIYYPEIAKRAGVEGEVVVLVSIDANGIVTKTSMIKAIGAGCDEAALDILSKTRYYPASIIDEKVPSEILVYLNFSVTDIIDKPDILLDEIIYEISETENRKRLILDKSGRAEFQEQKYQENSNSKEGIIPIEIYTKLSDFIISQCFLNYEDSYSPVSFRRSPVVTIIVFYGSNQKSVSSYGNNDGDPVGLWAITKVIEKLQDDIKWEIIE